MTWVVYPFVITTPVPSYKVKKVVCGGGCGDLLLQLDPLTNNNKITHHIKQVSFMFLDQPNILYKTKIIYKHTAVTAPLRSGETTTTIAILIWSSCFP